MYTTSAMYLRIDVKDDQTQANFDKGNTVVLSLDFGNEKTDTPDKNDVIIDFDNWGHFEEETLFLQVSRYIYPDHYTVGLRIPFDQFEFVPENGKLIGLEIFVYDTENGETKILAWNSTSEQDISNPSAWGLAEFSFDPASPPNQPPVVRITAPEEKSIFSPKDILSFAAQANDPDGDITQVSFHWSKGNSDVDSIGTDGWSLDWQPDETGAYSLLATAMDDDFEYSSSELIRFFVYEDGQPEVLLLVNDPNDLGNDEILKTMLEDRNGLKVHVRAGETATIDDAEGKRLIFISESISSRDSEDTFKAAKLPIICGESYIYDDLGMTGPKPRTDFGRDRGQMLLLQRHDHPLAADILSDTVRVLERETSLTFGRPSENASIIATLPDGKPAIFAYHRGDTMVDGIAPAARIGLFTSNSAMGELTEHGAALVNAAVQEKSDTALLPQNFLLKQNYPNPFNPTTKIEYHVAAPAQVKIEIYNTLGQKVRTLVDRKQTAGIYHVNWDATNDFSQPVAAGIYLYRLSIESSNESFVNSKKMLLIK